MCISMGPGTVFSGVVTAGIQVSKDVHALAYMNHAAPDPFLRRSSVGYGPNCMLLHVPGTLRDLVPSRGHDDFLKKMGNVVPSLTPAMTLGMTRGGGMDSLLGATRGFEIQQYGAYEVILADSAGVIGDALKEVSDAKRPQVNPAIVEWYGENYPDCAFVLACFNNEVEVADHPIVLTHAPNNPDVVFAPGLESHTGQPPALGAHERNRDFKVVFGSLLAGDDAGYQWDYGRDTHGVYELRGSDTQPRWPNGRGRLDDILPERVVGFYDEDSGANEDYVAKVDDVLAGTTGLDLFKTMPTHYEGSGLENAAH